MVVLAFQGGETRDDIPLLPFRTFAISSVIVQNPPVLLAAEKVTVTRYLPVQQMAKPAPFQRQLGSKGITH